VAHRARWHRIGVSAGGEAWIIPVIHRFVGLPWWILRERPECKRCVVRGLVENGWWRRALVGGLWVWSGLCYGSEGLGNV
jgi:hypothetical protein